MKLSRALILLAVMSAFGTNAWSKVLATVGQDTITSDDVNRIKKQMKENNPAAAAMVTNQQILEQLIDIKLGLMDARAKGMDKTVEGKEAMEAGLFNYYRMQMIDNAYRNKKFSKKEINDYYESNPMVRFQRLGIMITPGNSREAEKAYAELSIIRSDINAKKISFEKAIEKYATSPISGSFDRIPIPSLSPMEAQELRSLAPMEVSTIITKPDSVVLLRLIKVYPLTQDNIEPINERLRVESIMKARNSYFKSLRQKYSSSVSTQE